MTRFLSPEVTGQFRPRLFSRRIDAPLAAAPSYHGRWRRLLPEWAGRPDRDAGLFEVISDAVIADKTKYLRLFVATFADGAAVPDLPA